MDDNHPDEQPVSWDDAIRRLDAVEHRSSRRIRGSLAAAAETVAIPGHDQLHPVERRRRAGLAAAYALAAYRLAGGDPGHLLRVAGLGDLIGYADDVAGAVGDRARLARARVELALRPVDHYDSAAAAEHAAHVADVDRRAAALERPGAVNDVVNVSTPGESAAAHDDDRTVPDRVRRDVRAGAERLLEQLDDRRP